MYPLIAILFSWTLLLALEAAQLEAQVRTGVVELTDPSPNLTPRGFAVAPPDSAQRSVLASPGARIARTISGDSFGVYWIAPQIDGIYNSTLPSGRNLGNLHGQKGWTTRFRTGAVFKAGPVTVVAAPELIGYPDEEFDDLLPESLLDGGYRAPWYRYPYARADLPVRIAEIPSRRILPGESSVMVSAGPIQIGVGTGHHWWGPGIQNALVLSANAPGFPHAFVRTASPVRTALGTVGAVYLVGRLQGSARDRENVADPMPYAAFAGFAVTYSPPGTPDLEMGISRGILSNLAGEGEIPARAAGALVRWDTGSRPGEAASYPYDQITSLFARWSFPADGLSVHGEWARQELPESLDEFLQSPGYSSGYTLGARWSREALGGTLHLASEVTYLEQTSWVRPIRRFYTSTVVTQGYTHRGEIIGASIGPGASSQWLAFDYRRRRIGLGLFGERIRWDEDAYKSNVTIIPQFGHDVSLVGGARALATIGPFEAELEFVRERRMNYLFQNWALTWESAPEEGVDVINRSVRFWLRWAVSGAR